MLQHDPLRFEMSVGWAWGQSHANVVCEMSIVWQHEPAGWRLALTQLDHGHLASVPPGLSITDSGADTKSAVSPPEW